MNRCIESMNITMTSLTEKNTSAEKLKLSLHADIDDAHAEVRCAEERVRRATDDAARLAEELRAEQEHASYEEGNVKAILGFNLFFIYFKL